MTDACFYAKGLRFSCKQCSACCRYESGFVYLSAKDIDKLSAHLKMKKDAFVKKYCRQVTGWEGQHCLSLKEKQNKDCIFWDSGCTVYEARPIQCITFPFWDIIVDSAGTWETAATGCPGINSGTLHSMEKIKGYIEKRAAEGLV